ncbi:MAG: LemA family protein [Acidobacteria bacterium]|nr:LemA family protein [Acidobacteriota bacterium]
MAEVKAKKSRVRLMVIGAVIAVALIFGGSSISTYNTLVAKRIQIEGLQAQVENQMQRRADLIPNLVATVQGVAKQEQTVIGQVTAARARLMAAQTPQDRDAADTQLTAALRGLNFLSLQENYPELKSNESFLRLQDQLEGTENRLVVARRDYNLAVQDYNTSRSSFPGVLLARILGFNHVDAYYRAQPGAERPPEVKF